MPPLARLRWQPPRRDLTWGHTLLGARLVKLHRQLVLLLLAALLPLVVLSAVLGAGALRQGQEEMERDAQHRVTVLAASVGRELDAQIEVMQTVAQSPLLDGPLDQDHFAEIATRLLRDRPLWRAMTLSNPQGVRLLDYPRLPATMPRKVIDIASQAEAVSTGKPVIGRILKPPHLAPGFAIFTPVVRNGHVVAVLSAVIRPDGVRGLLQAQRLPAGWRGAVIDRSFRLVTRTMQPDVTGLPASKQVRDTLANAPSGFYRTLALDHTPVVTAYRTLPASGWTVHVAMPRAQYEAPFRRALWLVGLGAVTSLLIMVLFLSLLIREMRLRHREATQTEESRRLEALGRITGGVAHDFNNLLMIVQGSAELLKRRAGDDRTAALADAIIAAGHRGQTLTRQLLAFGRRSSHQPVSFCLQDRADEIRALLGQAVKNEVAVDLEIAPGAWPVHADPDALEMALINLAVNARDAMPEGGRLTVGAVNAVLAKGRDEGTGLIGDYVALSATDTGVGIPEERLAQVFEPFFTTKPPGKGTGLGLSQVYGFAKQSNGAVTIRSRVGEGATITLYLPRGALRTTKTQRSRAPDAQRERGHVLLVEDNAEVAEVTRSMLAGIGYSVSWSRDPAAALAAIEAGEPADVMVSDIALDAAMSGLELARLVRERRPALPIVLMTGYSEALASGVGQGFPVLAKPFGMTEVAAMIRHTRDTHGAEEEAPPEERAPLET